MDHTTAPEWKVLAIAENGSRFEFSVNSHGKEEATEKAKEYVRLHHGDLYAEDCTYELKPAREVL